MNDHSPHRVVRRHGRLPGGLHRLASEGVIEPLGHDRVRTLLDVDLRTAGTASFFGYRELARYTSALFSDSALNSSSLHDFGTTLVFWCLLLSRLGAVLIAIGLWKLGSALTPKPEEFPPA